MEPRTGLTVLTGIHRAGREQAWAGSTEGGRRPCGALHLKGGAPARRGGVGQPGEMGVLPGLPRLSTSLVIIRWHRCGEKGSIACLCLSSPRPSVSVCLSIRPVQLWRSLPRGLSGVNPRFLATLELGGEPGRKAKATPAPKPTPESSGGSGCAEEPCHAGGGPLPPPLPSPRR